MGYFEYSVFVALSAMLVWREYYWSKQYNVLLDRFMSRDFQQYKQFTRKPGRVIRNIPPKTDAELALWEMKQIEQLNETQSEIDKKLSAVAEKSVKVGST